MIAVVHGPIGCGKSTALHGWVARRGWGSPRGFRTRFAADVKGRAELRLESWDGRIGVAVAEGGRRPGAVGRFDPAFGPLLEGFLDGVFAGGEEDGFVRRKPSGFLCTGMVGADLRAARYKPSKRTARPEVGPYRDAAKMGSFSPDISDGVRFLGPSGCGSEGGECLRTSHSQTAALPWKLDAGRFWTAAVECLDGDAGRPLVIDELGVLETMPGALDVAALGRLVAGVKEAKEAIVVIQERALPFWMGCFGFS